MIFKHKIQSICNYVLHHAHTEGLLLVEENTKREV